MKKYLAEAFGTFGLALVVLLGVANKSPFVAFLAAITLGIFVYTIGSISGAHLNPAITIGLASIRKISAKDAVMYVVAQIIGAALALLLGHYMVGASGLATHPANTLISAVIEMIGTFFFAFGIASVATGKTPHDASGVVVGASLLIGIGIAGFLGSNALLNPAVALSVNSLNFSYLLGPIVGAVLGMQAYAWLIAE